MSEPRVLVLGGVKPNTRVIDLRDLGFVGHVSEEARAEIKAAERRSMIGLSTARRFWFD